MAVHSYIHVTCFGFFFWGGGGGGGGRVEGLGVKMYGGLCRFDFVIGLGSVLIECTVVYSGTFSPTNH